MQEKKLKVNMVLNTIKNVMSIIFPLVTFPYVSKVLQVDNLGKYNFCVSVISYFLLIASLGISSYAILEGSTLKENKKLFKQFANEMFTINIISSIIAYLLLFICIIAIAKFRLYYGLLLILSLQIFFTTIGIEWMYNIFEDYKYLTLRSIVFQIISLIMLFIFVKEKEDYIVYAVILTATNALSNIINYVNTKKYCRVKLTTCIDWKKHLKPILLIFSTGIATTIYVSSDITILGFIHGEYYVGLYSVSSKIYSVIKIILGSILVVAIPRLSSYIGQEKFEEFNKTASDVFNTLLSIMLPTITFFYLLSKEVILIISDQTYILATISYQLLLIALFFCMFAYFWGQAILLPLRKEKVLFIATAISAVVNIILNFILIPIGKQDAAAFTTIIAEFFAMIICYYEGRKRVKLNKTFETFIKSVFGCLFIVLFILIIRKFNLPSLIFFIISAFSSVIVYGIIEIIVKNSAFISLIGFKFKS